MRDRGGSKVQWRRQGHSSRLCHAGRTRLHRVSNAASGLGNEGRLPGQRGVRLLPGRAAASTNAHVGRATCWSSMPTLCRAVALWQSQAGAFGLKGSSRVLLRHRCLPHHPNNEASVRQQLIGVGERCSCPRATGVPSRVPLQPRSCACSIDPAPHCLLPPCGPPHLTHAQVKGEVRPESIAMAAVQQLPLQYSIGSDYDLQTRLCSKGLKGALLPRAHGRMGSDGAVERLPSPGHPLCTPAVVEVYSEWCGPCRSVLPTFKRVRTERDDEAAILFLTVGVRSPQQRRRRGGSAGGPLPRSLRAAPGPAPPTQKQQGLALSAVGGVCPRLAAMPAGHPTKEPPPPCRMGAADWGAAAWQRRAPAPPRPTAPAARARRCLPRSVTTWSRQRSTAGNRSRCSSCTGTAPSSRAFTAPTCPPWWPPSASSPPTTRRWTTWRCVLPGRKKEPGGGGRLRQRPWGCQPLAVFKAAWVGRPVGSERHTIPSSPTQACVCALCACRRTHCTLHAAKGAGWQPQQASRSRCRQGGRCCQAGRTGGASIDLPPRRTRRVTVIVTWWGPLGRPAAACNYAHDVTK